VVRNSRFYPATFHSTTEIIMIDSQNGLPPRYLRTQEAARFLGLSSRTLEKHRTYGTGPRYSKLGGRVVYQLADLQAWAARGAKASTSDPGVGTVLPAKRHAAIAPAYSAQSRR
jgi:predicted DNA-binding transcriptional regulator AlpA